MECVALDIETINTVEKPDFNTPEHWTVSAAALGYQNESMQDLKWTASSEPTTPSRRKDS
jgi:hypothetical protein